MEIAIRPALMEFFEHSLELRFGKLLSDYPV